MKKSRKKKIENLIFFLITCLVAFLFLLPILWMISGSLKSNNTIFEFPPKLIPEHPIWHNYFDAVTYIPFFKYFKNTLIISVVSTIGVVISTPSVAYAFAKMEWKGKNFVFVLVLSTLMLPFQVQMIPLYILFKKIGWIGTVLPLIVPNFFGNAMYIFLLRQFMIGLPKEMSESAFIDGASHFTILTKIVIPLCKPALFSIGLFTFLGNWTDFLGPLVYLTKQDSFTLSLGLQQYSSLHSTEWPYLLCACTLFTIPVLILFFFMQKTFIEGITFTGVKG